MDEMRLTREQLKQITGRKRPKEIIEWLRAGAFVFRLDSNGWPIVHPEHYAQQMGVKPQAGQRPSPDVKLDHLKAFAEKARRRQG